MAPSHLQSVAFFGLDAELIDVEADVKKGNRSHFVIVGLPDTAVKESKDRVLSALTNSGYRMDAECVVNLAPADLKKEGALYDLPIALAILLSQGEITSSIASDFLCVGELSLTGVMRPMRGALAAALLARKLGKKGLLLPKSQALEASVVSGIQIFGMENLNQAVQFLKKPSTFTPTAHTSHHHKDVQARIQVDFAEIKGQSGAKRALEIAASGGHNLLLFGPPGTGKTLLAKALAGILPPLSLDETLEVTKIHSLANLLPEGASLIPARPFRNPHHTISAIGLVGGGRTPRPGELSLAHLGILFLDELPEFSRHSLEVLRQPLENRTVTITRASTTLTFPTQCLFVAAMNPCPCGYLGHPQKPCRDTPLQIERYRSKISGPLLDRIDMHIEVPPISFSELSSERLGESTAQVRRRVEEARAIQKQRFQSEKCNGEMSTNELKQFCALDATSQSLIRQAVDKMGLSARAYSRILKVARTIADLDGGKAIASNHLMEALSFRSWEGHK
ncbi:MAG: YifB family Mg chelatase-like AAA ATPase [Chlamydiales bacterium]